LQLTEITLAGHSFGGLLALAYAAAHADKVARLVLIDPDPPTWHEWIAFEGTVLSRLDEHDRAELVMQASNPAAILRLSLRGYVHDRATVRALAERFTDESIQRMLAVSRTVRDDLGRYDFRPLLPRVTAPTLVITGARSIFPAESAIETVNTLAHARLAVIPDAGHFPHLENPAATGAAIRSFLGL
jgi:pimeloyl-ACP methyl ester carboxylesterase